MTTPPDDPKHLYGRTFDCECGKRHAIEPRAVVYAPDAASRLPAWIRQTCPDARDVCVVADIRTDAAAGHAVLHALEEAGFETSRCIIPDPAADASPVCDTETKDALLAILPDADLFIAAGAGVVSDLVKWCAHERNRPYISFATAISMNGYASANVAPSVGGVKTLVRAQPPLAVFADPQILADAPAHLTASGLGDILAKSVSSTDWKLNEILFGDFYCDRSVRLIEEIEPLYLHHPEGIRGRDPVAMEALFQGLLLTGVAMTMAESSSPSSGGEHMLSHTLDMMSRIDAQPHDLHGRQVGLGTILASELYRRVLAVEDPQTCVPPMRIDEPFWGILAPHVAPHFAEKEARMREAAERIPAQWDTLRATLAPMVRTPEAVRDCLREAGAAYRASDLGMDKARILAAFRHSHEIRARYTVLDLAFTLGILPGAAEEIVETWA